MATKSSNTVNQKFRNVVATVWNINAKPVLTNVDYIVQGLETCPTTGKKHLQTFMQLPYPMSISAIKKILQDDTAHLEKMWGTANVAAAYCKKGEQPKDEWDTQNEKGPNFGLNAKIVLEHGSIRNQGSRTDLKDIKKKIIEEGNIVDVVHNNIENFQQLKYAEGLMRYTKAERKEKPKVIWIFGGPGTSKTYTAMHLCPNAYKFSCRNNAKFWLNYNGQTEVIIDELRHDTFEFSVLLAILDENPYTVEVKGSQMPLMAKTIIITTPFHPREMFEYIGEDINQLLRRIDEIHRFTKVYDKSKLTPKEFINGVEVKSSYIPQPFTTSSTIDSVNRATYF